MDFTADEETIHNAFENISVDVLDWFIKKYLDCKDAAVFRCVRKFARDAVDATGRNLWDELRDELTERDLQVLRAWRKSCPELRDMWRGDDASHWKGVTWLDGRVTELHLACMRLSGQLPRLEGLTSLQEVNLCCNQLSAPITEKLFQGLTSLQEVRLFRNELSGPIPEKLFEGLTSLQEVYLSENKLSGPIPERLFEGLTSLHSVWLQDNELSGPIPERLRAVVKL